MDSILPIIERSWAWLVDYGRQPAFLIQVGVIVGVYLVAWVFARLLRPGIDRAAQRISGWPGLLRVVVAFRRRLEWLLVAVLLAIVYGASEALSWPEASHLIYGAMLLAGAWFTIYLLSHAIRSRAVGKTVAVVGWIFVTLSIMGVTEQVAGLLDSAGFSIGEVRFSILRLLQAIVILTTLTWLSLSVGNFLDRRIQKVDELNPSLRVLLGKILRIALLIFAVLVAMQGIGIDLTALTVLSGAVGVGIGFGLQKVVSNFISGIIILMDQSIKPGDTISLGETFGWIRELRARFVSVVTRDGREYLIPNEDFITREVINWSFSDNYVRLDVPFGVAYSSDPHEVTRVATQAAASVGRVNADSHKPVCWITGFGDSSIDFVLRFWIDDPQNGLTNVRGQVLIAVWDAFKAHDISIPFPHREIIMKTPVTYRPEADGPQPD